MTYSEILKAAEALPVADREKLLQALGSSIVKEKGPIARAAGKSGTNVENAT